jgi:hypothetical protein
LTERISDHLRPEQHAAADAVREPQAAPATEMGYVAQRAAKPRQHVPDSSYQNYLFGNAGSSEHPAWSDSAKGRFTIRLLSRGVVGAAFFTWGGRIADRHLEGYEPSAGWNTSKPLQLVAKGIDMTLGRAIEGAVRGIAGLKYDPKKAAEIGRNAVNFRDTSPKYTYKYKVGHNNYIPMQGRSYGADIVGFTFDFAMASIGDAMTRNIVQAFDPNVQKTWKLNEQGDFAKKGEKWHIDWNAWAKSVGSSTWRILSKNQGEDWAAAIPYAFQMKFQRKFLTKIFENKMDGHHLVFDRSWNGGAYKVDGTGKIIGDFQLAGAIDLHARFTGYNWYTLMFREGYDTIGNAFNQWKDNGYKISMPQLPEHFNPLTATVDAIGSSMRYVTKSFIKANLYMNPAVVPFWLFRVPQSKWRAEHFVEVNGNAVSLSADKVSQMKPDFAPFSPKNYETFRTDSAFDKFSKGFSRFLNPVGEASHILGGHVWGASKALHARGIGPKFLADEKVMRSYVDAAVSYTPYMYAKAEFGLRVDDSKGDGKPGQMDTAIYRIMDDVASFNFKGVPADLKKIWKLGTNFERDVVVREGGPAPATHSANKQQPATVVHASTVRYHDPALLKKSSHPTALSATDSNGDPERSWVQSVIGNDINPARIHNSSHTKH